MAKAGIYLNFKRNTEEAFLFYRSVFGGEFTRGGIGRFSMIPQSDESPNMAEEDVNLVLHVELPIPGGLVLMGTDAPESMGFSLQAGNTMHIHLEPDTKEETERLFSLLSQHGQITQPLTTMFWGAYFGSCIDQFGVQWMFNFPNTTQP